MALNAIGRKALLMGRHGLQRRLARQLEVDEARVSSVVNGTDFPRTERGWKSYNRIQRTFAKALGLTMEQAFSAEERGVESRVAQCA